MASTLLSKTWSTVGSTTKGTLSMWVKLDNNSGGDRYLYTVFLNNTNELLLMHRDSGSSEGNLRIFITGTGGANIDLATFRYVRDPSGWYHFVMAIDMAQSTNTNRIKLYTNGVQSTFESPIWGTDQSGGWVAGNTSWSSHIGGPSSASGQFFGGSMAMVEFVDGQQYGPEYFGSTNAATGIWTPSGGTSIPDYGTNGYKLAMDTTTPGADTSGKGNNFTVANGTPTLTQGNPQNNWCTLNPIDNIAASTFSNGNNTVATVSGNAACNTSTIGALTGKWYWEVKMTAGENSSEAYIIGLVNKSPVVTGYDGSILANGFGLRGDGNINNVSGGTTGGWNTFSVNNIINVAIDFDNGKAYFGTNGVYGNSSNPSTASNGYSFTVGDEFWRMAVNCRETSKTGTFQCNFGEGFFGTTAAGTNADDSGQGLFAYDVPSGYYVLNTKNLEAYG